MNLFITILLLTHVIGSCMPSRPYGTRYALGHTNCSIQAETQTEHGNMYMQDPQQSSHLNNIMLDINNVMDAVIFLTR